MAERPSASLEFYACLDVRSVAEVPQALQHLIIGNMSQALGGKILFYTMEDVYSASSHEVLDAKLAGKPKVDGLIFYRVRQFFDQKNFDLSFLRKILALGYQAHFARERISLLNEAELAGLHRLASVARHGSARDEGHQFFRDAYLDFLK